MFCICSIKKNLNTTDPIVIKHSNEIIQEINQRVQNYSQCRQLSLHSVQWAWSFKDIYHIQLSVADRASEGGQSMASFEAIFSEKMPSEMERRDRYSNTSTCILETDLQKIKPFCICKSF